MVGLAPLDPLYENRYPARRPSAYHAGAVPLTLAGVFP